jgi:hypothetical protein
MYKSFYEQVTTRVYQNVFQGLEALQPYIKESEGIQASVAAFLQDSPSKFFFPTSRSTQERRKIWYRRATYKKSKMIRRRVFCPTIFSIQGKRRIFIRQATYKGNVPCVLNQEFPFFDSRVLGFRSNPSWLKHWLLRDWVYKEAMCEGSTGNGLLYAAKAVP